MSDPSSPNLAIPATKQRRFGMKGSILLVGIAAALIWAAVDLRARARPALGLVRALRSSDPEARRDASQALIGLSPADALMAIPALGDALGDPDEPTDVNILLALSDAGLTAAQDPASRVEALVATAAITRALADTRAPVRLQAARILNLFARLLANEKSPAYDPSAVAEALARVALEDPALPARLEAAQTLLSVAKRSDLPPPAALMTTLTARDRPGDVRGVAAALLGAFAQGRRTALPVLAAALGDRDPLVRRGAAVGLAQFPAGTAAAALPALIPILTERISDPSTYKSPGLAITTATPDQFRFSTGVVNVAAPQPAQNWVAASITWDPAVMAAQAVGQILAGKQPPERAVEPLAEMLAANERWRREAAAFALNQVGRNAAPAIPALLAALLEAIPESIPATPPFADSGLTANLIKALAKTAPGTPEAAEVVAGLAQALASPAMTTAYQAAIALGAFGAAGAPALPALRVAARNPDQYIATKAAESILAIENPRPNRRQGGGDSSF